LASTGIKPIVPAIVTFKHDCNAKHLQANTNFGFQTTTTKATTTATTTSSTTTRTSSSTTTTITKTNKRKKHVVLKIPFVAC